MASLIQEIQSSHSHKHHLQNGVPDKHSSYDAGKRHQIILQPKRLGFARKCSYKHVWKHGKNIAEVITYIRDTVKAEGTE